MNVYVGMSGGVDSSLTAALLKEAGHTVTGVYMKNWTQDLPGMICPWAEDLADAKRVAVQLGIDLKVYDFESEYKQRVVDYMIDEYSRGRTPNPDIMCNQEIKFKLFFDLAVHDGADMIATGHYARTSAGQLLLAHDTNKDQTYFLYRVTKKVLEKTLFPLGEYDKPRVRHMAAQRRLYTAGKKDSQGICFVGQIGIRDFLSEYVNTNPGNIIDQMTGSVLGRHDGAIFYTLGQRHGLDVGGGLPYYVVGKDMTKNEVYVSTNLNSDQLWRSCISLQEVHMIDPDIRLPDRVHVRIRHRAPLTPARIFSDNGTFNVTLEQTQRAVTAGQSIVLYDDTICLGGGVVSAGTAY